MTVGADLVRTLYAPATRATGRVFDAAAGLDTGRLAEDIGAGAGSALATLAHRAGARRIWLARCRDRDDPGKIGAGDFADLAGLRQAWASNDAETRRFVDGPGESDLGATVRYLDARGRPNAHPLWQILVHQAGHQVQHRGEVALAPTSRGRSPGWLDLLYDLDLTGGREP